MVWLKYNNQIGCVSGLYGLPIPCASLAYPLLFDTRKKRGGQGEYVGIILIIVSKKLDVDMGRVGWIWRRDRDGCADSLGRISGL